MLVHVNTLQNQVKLGSEDLFYSINQIQEDSQEENETNSFEKDEKVKKYNFF